MPDTLTITLLVVAAVVIVLCSLLLWRWQHRRMLRQRFGSEYDRSVETLGDRRLAERDLEKRLDHFKEIELRDLDDGERRELARRWRAVQVDFVDRPKQAVESADRLVTETMRLRGYPEERFEQRLADASVAHPEVAADYREARRVAELSRQGKAETEDLRRAMVCYRNLFQALLGIEEVPPTDVVPAAPRPEVSR
jgi:hypothetical protein